MRSLFRGHLLIGVVGALGCGSGLAVAPPWATVVPQGYQYNYVVGAGAGGDPRTARAVAIQDAYEFLVQTGPREYRNASFRQQFVTMAEEALRLEGPVGLRGTQQLRTEGVVDGTIAGQSFPRLEVVASELQRCSSCQSEVIAYLLFRYPKPAHLRRSPPPRVSYAARSLVIPGWGQMAKGQGAKGRTLLTFTALGAGTGALGYVLQQRALDSAAAAGTLSDRARYLDQADQYNRLRLGGFALAAGLYTFGVIDALAGPVKLYPLRASAGPDGARVGVEIPFRLPIR